MPGSRQHGGGSLGRGRERDKNCTPVVRETQRISRILFFCFRTPFSHHSHTNGVNKAFFPSGATTYAAVLALRPGTEPCDHHHVSLPKKLGLRAFGGAPNLSILSMRLLLL